MKRVSAQFRSLMPARLVRAAVIVCTLIAVLAWRARPRPFDSAPFLADLQALEDSLARGYANLEWQVAQGVVDPVLLHARTDSILRNATSEREARAALTAFGAAFLDGHLRVAVPPSPLIARLRSMGSPRSDAPPAVTLGASKVCGALGYTSERSDSPLARHPGYHALGSTDGPFRTGRIDIPGGPVGVIRLGALGYDRFVAQCESVWPTIAALDSAGLCASRCERALGRVVSNALLAEVRAAISRVHAAGATALVVDLTGNGGGTNWTAAVARQFSARPLRSYGVGVVRHPHHERQFVERRDALVRLRDSLRIGESAAELAWRANVDSAISRTEALLAMTRQPCDRRAYFTIGAAAVPCTQLTTGGYTSGAFAYLPTALHTRPGASLLFDPASYTYSEGVWSGPLFLLVDRNTASASEEFVALLKDEGHATVIGQRTYGAGCGFTNGGIGFTLSGSGMRVTMPDCARIRHNGRNEVSGIEVDATLPIDADTVVRYVMTALAQAAQAPDPIAVFERAVERGRAGDRAGALQRLDSLSRLPGGLDPSFHRLFLEWRDDSAYQRIVARVRAANPPLVRSTIAYRFAERDLHPEGLAFDPQSRALFVGSFKGKIIRVTPDGTARDFAQVASRDSARVVVGIRVDTVRNTLWATVDDPRAFSDPTIAGGALHRYDLATGRLNARFAMPAPGALNDVVVTSTGDAYATNTVDGSVWRTMDGREQMRPFLPAGTAPQANGIALDATRGTLFVAAAHEIVRVELATGRRSRLVNGTTHPLGSFDGLYWWNGGLVGVQNGVHPGRIVRLTLDEAATTVTAADILERYHPQANGVTTAALDGDALFYIVNTQSRAFRADGTPIDRRLLTDILVARLPLR